MMKRVAFFVFSENFLKTNARVVAAPRLPVTKKKSPRRVSAENAHSSSRVVVERSRRGVRSLLGPPWV